MFNNLNFLTNTPTPAVNSNPAGYLETMKSGNNGTFSKLTETLQKTIADAYGMLTAVGIGLIGVCLVAAFIMFGVMKDNSTIKENKQWILRLLIAVIGVSCVVTIVGIAAGIGQSIN